MRQTVWVTIEGIKYEVEVDYLIGDKCELTVKLPHGKCLYSVGDDLFICLEMLRRRYPGVIFLCKGARKNVYPSRMSRQMAHGLVAYEYTMGKPAKNDNIVNIFEFDDKEISSTPDEQENNYQRWLSSLMI